MTSSSVPSLSQLFDQTLIIDRYPSAPITRVFPPKRAPLRAAVRGLVHYIMQRRRVMKSLGHISALSKATEMYDHSKCRYFCKKDREGNCNIEIPILCSQKLRKWENWCPKKLKKNCNISKQPSQISDGLAPRLAHWARSEPITSKPTGYTMGSLIFWQ